MDLIQKQKKNRNKLVLFIDLFSAYSYNTVS